MEEINIIETKIEENKTHELYETDYNHLRYIEMKNQYYIDDLVRECGLPNYNIDKINLLLKLTNGPNVRNINGRSPLDVAFRHNNIKLIKYLIEQHNAERKIVDYGYFGDFQLSARNIDYLLKNEVKQLSFCNII